MTVFEIDQAHSETCTEQFYKEHVSEELQHRKATPEEQKRMMEILRRDRESLVSHEQTAEGEAGEPLDLTEGLAELDLENLSLEDLTPAQRRDFERAVVDGRLGNGLEAWVAWWDHRDVVAESMALPDDIPTLTDLTGKPPKPVLVAHVADILFAYAYAMRRHNGDTEEVNCHTAPKAYHTGL